MHRAGEDHPKRQQGRTRKRTHAATGHLPEPASSKSSKRRLKHQQDPSSAAQPQQQPSNQAGSSTDFPSGLVTCAYVGDSETSFAIPVVNFGAYSLSENDVPDEQLQSLSKELKSAFTKVGFVFLKNMGITQQKVADVMDISKKFFLQPDELKQPFSRSSFTGDGEKWPSSGSLKCFREILTSFFHCCKELSLQVLRVMAHSLGLDPDVFLSKHHLIGTDKNGTTLRSLYYPPVNCEKAKEGQLQCGEHSDYGTITLLFQSSEGLQVCARSGEFISVPCIPGAILINIADLMQRWTSDQFVSVLHRVLLPSVGDSSTRQSLAFFVHPDDEALITCCDNSNKYPPITAGAYLTERFNESYGRS